MSNNGFFEGKKVLVAGGTGMIGRPLVEMLLDKGADVRVASRDNPSRANSETEFIQCDLTHPDNCRMVCEGMDIVFNLLCTKGSPITCQTKPASYLVPMILYNTHLMEQARLCGVKTFLFTSSVCVYPPSEIFFEDDPLEKMPSPNDMWAGLAKRAGEFQARSYQTEYGWNSIPIVRPSNVYGPYDNFDPFNAMVVPGKIREAIEAVDRITVRGDGTAERDFIYCDDVARGMLLAVEKGLSPQYPINLGVGYGISIKKLVEIILKISGKDLEIIFDTSKPSGDKKRIFDITRSKKIGFEPLISLEEGVKRTYNWYLNNRGIAEDRYDIFKQSRIN